MENSRPSILYVVAGPPGVGKSTNAKNFINKKIAVENSDIVAVQLRNQGEKEFEELAFEQLRADAYRSCEQQIDFGIELNLGLQIPHYSLINHWRDKYNYSVHVLLFFTDTLSICIDRADQRSKSKGLFVAETIIKQMYDSTLPLLRKNISCISHLQLIDVTYNSEELVYSGYYPAQNHEFVQYPLPKWVVQNFPEIAK